MRIGRLGFLVLCLLAPGVAAADDSGWYLALDAGSTQFANTLYVPGLISRTPVTTPAHYENSSTGYRFSGGYQFDAYLGAELDYADLGHQSMSADVVSHPQSNDCGPACETSYHFISAPRPPASHSTPTPPSRRLMRVPRPAPGPPMAWVCVGLSSTVGARGWDGTGTSTLRTGSRTLRAWM